MILGSPWLQPPRVAPLYQGLRDPTHDSTLKTLITMSLTAIRPHLGALRDPTSRRAVRQIRLLLTPLRKASNMGRFTRVSTIAIWSLLNQFQMSTKLKMSTSSQTYQQAQPPLGSSKTMAMQAATISLSTTDANDFHLLLDIITLRRLTSTSFAHFIIQWLW